MNIEKLNFLPTRLVNEILKYTNKGLLEEIRIRKNKNAYLIVGGVNLPLNIILTENEMQELLLGITHNSLYAYRETIINGYVIYENNLRVGIIGSASVEDGRIVGIFDISEIAIRIPNLIEVDTTEILELARNYSVLFYSPPGEGKTTLLRCLIRKLSKGRLGKRVGVIDSRGELSYGIVDKSSFASILCGYPRKIGIEIAVRTMNSQIIVCDEIGDERDSTAIIDAQGAGVPIIASCHGSSVRDILSHTGILNLHRHHIFDYYVGIKRGSNLDFTYTINTWSDVNDYL